MRTQSIFLSVVLLAPVAHSFGAAGLQQLTRGTRTGWSTARQRGARYASTSHIQLVKQPVSGKQKAEQLQDAISTLGNSRAVQAVLSEAPSFSHMREQEKKRQKRFVWLDRSFPVILTVLPAVTVGAFFHCADTAEAIAASLVAMIPATVLFGIPYLLADEHWEERIRRIEKGNSVWPYFACQDVRQKIPGMLEWRMNRTGFYNKKRATERCAYILHMLLNSQPCDSETVAATPHIKARNLFSQQALRHVGLMQQKKGVQRKGKTISVNLNAFLFECTLGDNDAVKNGYLEELKQALDELRPVLKQDAAYHQGLLWGVEAKKEAQELIKKCPSLATDQADGKASYAVKTAREDLQDLFAQIDALDEVVDEELHRKNVQRLARARDVVAAQF